MNFVEKYFPFLILLTSGIALFYPPLFLWIKPHITILLGFIMFSIGMTLDFSDFKQAFTLKWKILLLATLKFLILPCFAYLIAQALQLSNEEFIGLMIVSACPGGTAASVMSYLSRSNVALTVTLTLLTTMVSPLITPIIIYFFLHEYIEISFSAMVHTIFWIVLFPLADGLIIRRILGNRLEKIRPVLPIISMLTIAAIIACIVAMNHKVILSMPVSATFAILILNVGGLLIGYILARKLFNLDSAYSRAVAFEFGIFDVAIGVMLATKFFGVATAFIGAVFAIIQNLTGITVVRYTRLNSRTVQLT